MKKYYAWRIYKLQRKLGIRARPLLLVMVQSLEFFRNNLEFFGEFVEGEKVLKVMIEKGCMPDKPTKTKISSQL